MPIFEEDKMLQDKDIYSTERTPSYADWALFNMGKELEEKYVPPGRYRDIRVITFDVIGGDNPLLQPFWTQGGYTYDKFVPLSDMQHLLPKGYRFLYYAPIQVLALRHIRVMINSMHIDEEGFHITFQNWNQNANVTQFKVAAFIVKD